MFDPQNRRRLLVSVAVAVAAAGSGCSHAPILELVAGTGKDVLDPGGPENRLTRERIDRIPYASLGVKIGDQPRAVLILSRYDRENLHWLSADRAALVTHGGRLIKTAGFPLNLTTTTFYDADPVRQGTLHKISDGYRMIRGVDLRPGNRVGVLINSTFRVDGRATIEIVESTFETVRITEINRARGLDWGFENTYWVDPESGFVWKSVQSFAPGLPPARIEVLRPALPPS